MTKPDDHFDDAADILRELWVRIFAGDESAETVLADMAQRDAQRAAAFEAERQRLQAEIDICTATMLRHEGKLQ